LINMKKTLLALSVVFFFQAANTQQHTKDSVVSANGPTNNGRAEITDSFRLNYQDVYENMHYDQPLRPQVHYTPIAGQIADPTGLIKYNGIYHLFYMFDEWSKQRRDNKNWGHAISTDCIHWEQQPPVLNTLIDNRPGSGSGIIDWNNTLRLQTGTEKTIAIFYTDYGRGISLAYSKDAGKTWVRHKNNPLMPIKNGFRDPVVFWYQPDQSWRMVIYEEPGVSFYKSVDLLSWQFLSKLGGYFECPDFIHMPVDGSEDNKKWVLMDGNGAYTIGEFDGTIFSPQQEKKYLGEKVFYNRVGNRINYYTKDIYATQTWKQSYEGDGPFYQMAFMMIKGAPTQNRTWSQQLIFPVELTLKTIDGRIQLCRNPIDGIKGLRDKGIFLQNETIRPGENPLKNLSGDVYEMIFDIDIGQSKEIDFAIRGQKAIYETKSGKLTFMDSRINLIPSKNRIRLRILIDRNSVEIYGNEGENSITRLFYPESTDKSYELSSIEGSITMVNMEIYPLRSIWLKKELEMGYYRNLNSVNHPCK
jgi:fructan beta-fructosidase